MNILIRCDAGGIHGMGHAIRMKALADALSGAENQIAFISNTPESLSHHIAPYPCTHSATVALDPHSREYGTADVIVVDTKYPIEETWYRGFGAALQGKVVRIEHPHATPESCDLLVMPNVHLEEQQAQMLHMTFRERFLYGWDYVMLSPGVGAFPPLPKRHASRCGVVFCAGGSDPTGALDMMIEWSIKLELSAPLVFLRPCSQSRYLRALRHARLVVGMFGVTAYECLWYRTPMLMFSRNDAETMAGHRLQGMAENTVCIGGLLAPWTQEKFCDLVRDIYRASVNKVMEMPSFMDGHGTERVAEAILALGG